MNNYVQPLSRTTIWERCKTHKPQCGCPACRGLACLERPRFFAGQLLTEEELNLEQGYQMAKNRLQNRYLHGPGVVCGLEVSCSDCEGQVHIDPGYAIDPCGNDILVCEPTTFNVAEAITKCCERATRKRDDCDPYQPPPAKGCEEVESTWCITIEYREKQARPVSPLKPPRKSCGCGCGGSGKCTCGGGTGECGCGSPRGQCGCLSEPDEQTTTVPASSGLTAVGCEPTRIRETYCLGIMEEPEWCKNLLRQRRERDDRSLLPASILNTLALFPEDSLIGNILACWKCAFQILGATVKSEDWSILLVASNGQLSAGQTTPAELHAASCRLRQAVIDLFTAYPHNVRCQLLKVLDQIDCPPPQPHVSLKAYEAQISETIRNLLTMIVQYLLDCICEAFMPPCSPDPYDNRVILACVTVKGGKILRICHFGCRSYAGSFPTLYYWLSAIPIASLVKMLLEYLCCSPDLIRANSPLVNDLFKYLERLDPGAEKRQSLFADNFAGLRALSDRAGQWLDKFTVKKVRDVFAQGFEGATGLNRYVGRNADDVKPVMASAKVNAHYREVASEAEMKIPPSAQKTIAREGDEILVYVKDGKVLGFSAYSGEERLKDKEIEIDKKLADLNKLREELERFRRG